MNAQPCCNCASRAITEPRIPDAHYIDGRFMTPVAELPRIKTRIGIRDRLGACAVRLGLGRDRYRVVPGLYVVGNPGANDPVLVTANYKLRFDALRSRLDGRNHWLLVLDTQGINVWCAAGKGTFSSAELVDRIHKSGLTRLSTGKLLILPQLGAPGVSAHQVKRSTGFSVVFGPVRAGDLPRFLDSGLQADAGMRRVTFTLSERLAVVPLEIMGLMKYYLLYLLGGLIVLSLLGKLVLGAVLVMAVPPLGAWLSGALLLPLLLPAIPFRSFALKGWLIGIVWAVVCSLLFPAPLPNCLGYLLLLPAITAFISLNFTGSTTFTSQSGVNWEIAGYARPIGLSALMGLIVFLAGIWL